MKNYRIYFLAVCMLGFFALFPGLQASAAETVEERCGYQNQGTNPDFSTMNCLLTETALDYDVPPEIVKAIAEVESGNWVQFDENGEAIVTADGGIGVMQLTNQSGYKPERLRNDVAYNIQAGVETLDGMFERRDLPVINNGDRDVLEHWYFAIMAYNGIKPVNSPIIQATGAPNPDAYQEKVFEVIERYSLINVETLSFSRDDFSYDSTSDENIEFNEMQFHFDVPLTTTKHEFVSGQSVGATTDVNLRAGPTTGSSIKGTLQENEKVTIEGPFEYELNNDSNHFVWYPVTRSGGTSGYVASTYLKYRFHDVPAGHYAEEEIYYLADKGIFKGVGDDYFGLENNLTRWQAVLVINRAEGVSLANRPDPGFQDVPQSYKYYEEIAAAVDAGLFEGLSDTEFKPDAPLTRAQMAVLLDRLYEFPANRTPLPFTDVKTDYWYTDAIQDLYGAGITNGISASEFAPAQTVTREQFATFLSRSIYEGFRTK